MLSDLSLFFLPHGLLVFLSLFTVVIWGVIPYLLYPGFVRLFHHFLRIQRTPIASDVLDASQWPSVTIVFAAYNEEVVLEEKLASLQALDYPHEKMNIRVGSDCSTDDTEKILSRWAKEMPNLHWERMPERSGKSKIINYLVSKSNAEVVVGTDANIFFDPMALKHLVAPLILNRDVALVGGELAYRGLAQEETYRSIAQQEKSYIGLENHTKVCEGELWGMTMGVEGGCYAIRRAYFTPIPPGTFMEDFFLTIQVVSAGKKVVHASNAKCSEDVSNDAQMEFKRKVRISHGNWQNSQRIFFQLIQSLFSKNHEGDSISPKRKSLMGFVFVGHKFLRWIFPLAVLCSVIIMFFTEIALCGFYLAGINLLVLMLGILFLLYPGWILPRNIAKRVKPLSYFAWMNIALILGLWQFLRTPAGSSGVWQPTKRNNQ